jgi:hypothetical protein
MKASQSPCLISRSRLSTVTATCFSMMSATAWGFGLAGDEIEGSLQLPWAPGPNYFSTSSTIVGPGTEFAFYQLESTFAWSVTADISDDRITINQSLSDPNPGYWSLETTDWTLTLSGLDWDGATGISSATVVSQDPNISLLGFDAHSVQFQVGEMRIYPSGPFSHSQTTVIQLAAVPEPSAAALLLCGVAAAFWQRDRRS